MEDLSKMKVADLKKLLKERHLSALGNKAELLERLQEAEDLQAVGDVLETTDDDLGDANDSLLKDEAGDLELSVEKLPVVEKAETEDSVKVGGDGDAAVTDTDKVKVTNVITPPEDKKVSRAERFGIVSEDTKIVKRAERFGIVSEDATKQKRAERFGTSEAPKAIVTGADSEKLKKRAERFGTSVTSQSDKVVDVDLLKKRAERFGQVTSTQLSKIDLDDKLLKRKERFGAAPSTEDEQDKKKARGEKFSLITV